MTVAEKKEFEKQKQRRKQEFFANRNKKRGAQNSGFRRRQKINFRTMIQRIEHRITAEAKKIRRVFQISYKVEAQLLGAINFPPLKRPVSAFENCANNFFGYYEDGKLVAVIEMKREENSMHIQKLSCRSRLLPKGNRKKTYTICFKPF